MPAPLLWLKHQLYDRQCERELVTIAREVGEDVPCVVGIATAGGDERRLRGIPVVGARGVGGAIPGSKPEVEVMRVDRPLSSRRATR